MKHWVEKILIVLKKWESAANCHERSPSDVFYHEFFC